MRHKLLLGLAGMVLLSSAAVVPATAEVDGEATHGTITVDAARSYGRYVRVERYNNLNHTLDSEQMDQLAAIGTSNVRIFVHAQWWYPTNDKTAPDFSFQEEKLEQISTYADSITVVVKTLPQWLRSSDPDLPNNWDDYEQMITSALLHYKQSFPKLEIVDVLNEPTVEMSLTIDEYMRYYRIYDRAAAYVNARRPAGSQELKLSGPVMAGFWGSEQEFIQAFLDRVKAEHLRLDYVSWHYYWIDPKWMTEQVETVQGWIEERGLNAKTQVGEYGYRSTINNSPTAGELARQAAYSAAIGRHMADTGVDLPMSWNVNHAPNNFLFNQFFYDWQTNARNNELQTFAFPAHDARYIRIEGINVYNPPGGLAVSEAEIAGPAGTLPVSDVSVTWNHGDAGNVIDGDLDSFWTGDGGHPSKLVTLDLGSATTVDKVRLAFPDGADVTYKFSAMTSTDGVRWKRVVGSVEPYPTLNHLILRSMLKGTRVSATTDALTSGVPQEGLDAMATTDRSGRMAILVWNYQDQQDVPFDATLRIDNLPANLRGDVRMERYLVDATHSNYAADPSHADLQKVTSTVLEVDRPTLRLDFPMATNAVSVVVLTPRS